MHALPFVTVPCRLPSRAFARSCCPFLTRSDLKPGNVLLNRADTDCPEVKLAVRVLSQAQQWHYQKLLWTRTAMYMTGCPVPWVQDFGLSRVQQATRETMTPEAGTPAYMAPGMSGPHQPVKGIHAGACWLVARGRCLTAPRRAQHGDVPARTAAGASACAGTASGTSHGMPTLQG